MTALWIAFAVLFCLWVCTTAATLFLWIYCAAMTTVLNSHRNDKQMHWSSKWEDGADA